MKRFILNMKARENIVSLNPEIGHQLDSYVAFDNAFVQHIQKSRFWNRIQILSSTVETYIVV